jgi:WD40-like Beta Propeller Repeat
MAASSASWATPAIGIPHSLRTVDSWQCPAPTSRSTPTCVQDLEREVTTHITHGGTDRFPVWSRDGKTLAYRAGDAALIFEVPADGSGPPQRVANLTGVPSDWSDDHRLLFFRPEQGTVALATYQVPNGDLRSIGAGSEAQFSPDGRWLLHGGQEGIIVRRWPDGHVSQSACTEARNRDGAVTVDTSFTSTHPRRT